MESKNINDSQVIPSENLENNEPLGLAAREREIDSALAHIDGQVRFFAERAVTIDSELAKAANFRAELEQQAVELATTLKVIREQVKLAKLTQDNIAKLQIASQDGIDEIGVVKQKCSAAMADVESSSTSATATAARLGELATQAELDSSTIAVKSSHIEDGRVHVDKTRAELDKLCMLAQASEANAAAHQENAKSSLTSLEAILAEAQNESSIISNLSDAIDAAKLSAENSDSALKTYVKVAGEAERRVSNYETKLKELESAAAARVKQIESLLPGATSAGLATAFVTRRDVFRVPQIVWQLVFIATLVASMVLGVYEFGINSSPDKSVTIGTVCLSLLLRLPLEFPLLWLAFHAVHQAALAKRIEEDYAFKATVASSFEGFRREMAEVDSKDSPASALGNLCLGVLATITNPPGRLYEKHRLTRTPLNAIADSAGPIADAASKILPNKIDKVVQVNVGASDAD